MKRLSFVISSTLAIGFVWLAAPLRAQFVYVVNLHSNNVSAYSIGANGALTRSQVRPSQRGIPVSVAVDPTGKFAYVATSTQRLGLQHRCQRGPDAGSKGRPSQRGTIPSSVAVDPTGKFVYVANEGDNTSRPTASAPTGP